MLRLFVIPAALLPLLAVAAPVPKPPSSIQSFGTVVETKGVTCASPRRGELRVNVSKAAASEAKAHDEARPVVARTVEGDFELVVRITHAAPDGRELVSGDGGERLASAGIALHKPDGKRGSLVVLNRLSNDRGTWDSYFRMFALYETKGGRGAIGGLGPHREFSGDPIHLRLTRRGDVFTAARSDDGKEWSPVFESPHEVPGLGAAVVVGPVAAHNTNGRYDVTFDQYTLTQLPEKKK